LGVSLQEANIKLGGLAACGWRESRSLALYIASAPRGGRHLPREIRQVREALKQLKQ
jgi:hypothetical protein